MTSVKRISDTIKLIQKKKRDAFIVIDGRVGEGKSTLGILIAKKVDRRFKFKRNVTYSKQDLVHKINNLPEGSSILVDEGSFVFFRRDFMKKDQKELLKLLEICRYRQLCFIVCIPSFWGLDNHLLKSNRIKLRLFVPTRGKAILFKPKVSAYTWDPWNQKYNEKAETKKRIKYHSDNFVGRMKFKPLSEKEYEEYEKVKKEAKEELQKQEADENKEEVIPEDHKKIITLLEGGKHNAKEIAKIVDMSERNIYRLKKKYLNSGNEEVKSAEKDIYNNTNKGDNEVEG